MIPLTLAEVAAAVGGTVDPAHADVLVTGPAYLDSRAPEPGGLFVAVVGERTDGHDHAAGAHAVLGERPTAAPTVVTDDTVAALGRLARHVLDRLGTRPRVLALTGSQGKTGTKDYLAAVLAEVTAVTAQPGDARQVVATAGNGNNEIGVPLTVLRATEDTTHLVVEMGARGRGHVAYLCTLAPPDVSAVLNIGSAHVGEFGSREAIAEAKGEIVEALGPEGTAVLNADDALSLGTAPRTRAVVATFGEGDAATVGFTDVTLDALGRPSFTLHHAGAAAPVSLRQSGAHQVRNAAAAAAMALACDLPGDRPLERVAAALSRAEAASRWRMEVDERSDGLVVVNDAYNANPESVRAALRALVDIGATRRERGGRTVAVLGEMRELGDEHEQGHAEVGAEAARLGVDVVVVVGTAAEGVARAAEAAGAPDAPVVVRAAGREEATAWVRHNASGADVVLVKASRGAALEVVAEQLLAHDPGTDHATSRGSGHGEETTA